MGYPTYFLNPASSLRRLLLLATHHRPALELGDGAVLLDPHGVAHLELVALVVGVVFLRPADGLSEDRMREAALDAHHHRLALFVAHHDALQAALGHLLNLLTLGRAFG